MEQWTVQKIESSDSAAVMKIWESIVAQSSFPIGGNWTSEKLDAELEMGSGLKLFTADGKDLASFVLYRRALDLCEITLVGCDPRFWGKNVIDEIWRKFIEFESPRTKEVWLEVHQDNIPALGMYKRWGFSVTGRRLNYYGKNQDAILLGLQLPVSSP